MPDQHRPYALILARPDNPLLPQLVDALSQQGLRGVACPQAAQAFVQLARRDPAEARCVVAIILEAASGMPVPNLAKSLRGMPGHTDLPLILVDGQAVAPPRAVVVRPPVAALELARLAAMPPESWQQAAVREARPMPASIVRAAGPAGADAAPSDGIILVVDDDKVNRLILGQHAKRAGLPVESCSDGAAAVARVATGGVRLVLMDCQMPVMDGYDATRAIRRSETMGNHRLPIIAVTAHALESNRLACREAGMDDFLTKPVTQQQLLQVIRRWLESTTPPSPAASGARAASVAVLDPLPLGELEDGTPGSGRTLAGILFNDLPAFRDAVQQLLHHRDLAGLGRAAHSLKGSSGSLGAMELFQACCTLEQAAKANDAAACTTAVAAAQTAVGRLGPVLAAYIASRPETTGQDVAPPA